MENTHRSSKKLSVEAFSKIFFTDIDLEKSNKFEIDGSTVNDFELVEESVKESKTDETKNLESQVGAEDKIRSQRMTVKFGDEWE